MLLLLVLVPFITAFLLVFLGKVPNVREGVSIFAGLLNTALVIATIFILEGAPNASYSLIFLTKDIHITLYYERMGMLFALLINFLWVISIIYSIGYMRAHHEINQTRFFSFFAISIGSALGVALSANLWTTFLFYEVLTLATFPLVGHNLNAKNKNQVFTYLGVLVVSSMTLFLAGIVFVYLYASSVDFTKEGVFAAANLPPYLVILILLLFIFGVAKAAVMPMHSWLPAAMVAPTPVSALLHAVAVVKSGVFILAKVVIFIFGAGYLRSVVNSLWDFNWLLLIPAITILLASTIALFQDSLKKRLAYSTISQLSYVLLGLLMLTPYGLMGGVTQIFAHAFGKITLFFAAGAIIVLAHKNRVSELDGIGKQMPITMFAFTLGALSMIGFPITFGFLPKWYMVNGALQSEQYFVLFVIIASTILNTLYFFPIIFRAFFKTQNVNKHKNDGQTHHHEVMVSRPMDIAMGITTLGIIALNFYGYVIINFLF